MSEPGTQIYTVQRYDVVAPGSANHTCAMVALTLAADGTFALTLSTASNDWGTRREDVRRYTGRYERVARGVVCTAAQLHTRMRAHDHDTGESADEATTQPTTETFEFTARSEGGLVCPVDFEGLRGVLMSDGLRPNPGVF